MSYQEQSHVHLSVPCPSAKPGTRRHSMSDEWMGGNGNEMLAPAHVSHRSLRHVITEHSCDDTSLAGPLNLRECTLRACQCARWHMLGTKQVVLSPSFLDESMCETSLTLKSPRGFSFQLKSSRSTEGMRFERSNDSFPNTSTLPQKHPLADLSFKGSVTLSATSYFFASSSDLGHAFCQEK